MQGKQKNGWKNKTWRRKTDKARYYQWLIQETLYWLDLCQYGSKIQLPTALNYQGIAMSLVFFIPPKELRVQDGSKFKGRDVSNYIKIIEDAVFEYLGRTDGCTWPQDRAKIQDSSSIEPLSFKRVSWDDDWHIQIWLSDEVWAHQQYAYHAGQVIDVYESAYTGVPQSSREVVRQYVGSRSVSSRFGSGTSLPSPPPACHDSYASGVPVS